MKVCKYLPMTVFILILSVATAVSFVKPETEFSATENRMLETRPEPDIEDILSGDYQETYEAYLNDQFFFRDRFVDIAVEAMKLIGRRDVNGVYLGSGGYLLEKYTEKDFLALQAENNCSLLADAINILSEKYGTEHVTCMMIPGKANVMTEMLPAHAKGYDEQKIIEDIRDMLTEPEMLIDATEVLKAHQEEYIYYRTDHHWTTLGAYYGYTALAKRMGYEAKPIAHYERQVISDVFYGTGYNKSHQKVKPDTVELFLAASNPVLEVDFNDGEKVTDSCYLPEEIEGENDKYRIFFGGNTAKIDIRTKAGTGRTLVVLKDSYANSLIPFLTEEYDRIIMLDLRYASDLLPELLEEYEDITDVLIMYNVEKFLQDTKIDLLDMEIAEDEEK